MSRGISKNKVSVMSFNNKPDGNRLVEHFNYLIRKGHQVDADESPRFLSNIGSTKSEVVNFLQEYRENFVQAKADKKIARNTALLGKGIVFCNLPNSMTSFEVIELAERTSAVLPKGLPQVYVFHNKNRKGEKYTHLHLMFCVDNDGSKNISADLRNGFHDKLIDVVNQYTNELGYERKVTALKNPISSKATRYLRNVAKSEAKNDGVEDIHQGMLNNLKSPYFWKKVSQNKIEGEDVTSVKILKLAAELADNLRIRNLRKSYKKRKYVYDPLDELIEECLMSPVRYQKTEAIKEAPAPVIKVTAIETKIDIAQLNRVINEQTLPNQIEPIPIPTRSMRR